MSDATTDHFCCHYSRAVGEDMIATVKPAAVWLLLEYDARWERKALEESDIPPAVKDHLFRMEQALGARSLAVRQKPRLTMDGHIAFFVAIAREHDPVMYEFHLERYEDLLALDLDAVCEGHPAFDDYRRAEPLYTVCTHGRRDACCARLGIPLYTELVSGAGSNVWQSSHVGGHRFAANMICFPHGVYYGRVGPDDGETIRAAYERGELVLDRYRGRACYPKPAQAAEFYLRLETRVPDIAAYQLAETERVGPEEWLVRFASRRSIDTHEVHLREELGALRVLESCDSETPSEVSQWRLVRHETITAVGD